MPQVCITSNLQISRGCQWILLENIGRNATFMPLMGECLDLRNCSDTLRYHLNRTRIRSKPLKPIIAFHHEPHGTASVRGSFDVTPGSSMGAKKNWCFMKMRIGSQETHPRRSSAQFPGSRSHRAYERRASFWAPQNHPFRCFQGAFSNRFPWTWRSNLWKQILIRPWPKPHLQPSTNMWCCCDYWLSIPYNGRGSVATKLRTWLGPCSRSSCYSTICQNSSGLSNHSCWCSSPELHVGMNLINMWGMKEQV